MNILAKASLLGIIALFSGGKASADIYDLTFTASGATITGGIVFDKSATDLSVMSLISTDLTIEGHLYSIGDLNFINNIFGGPNVGICSKLSCAVRNATNDFLLRYNQTTGAFTDFMLGTPFPGTDSGTTTFTKVQQVSSVPGPVVGAGLPGLICAGGGLLG